MAAVELKDVSYTIDGRKVLNNISFVSNDHTATAILGPSGVGKSTLLNLIAGFEKPDKGEIHINGKLVAGENCFVTPEKRGIGILFQDLALFPHLTVRSNIAFGIKNLSGKKKNQRVEHIAKQLEINGFLDRYPHQISGGQQQRLALARALAPCPTLLLLDEPFSNQDTDLRSRLAGSLKKILTEEGISSVMVTHDHDEAFLSDMIGILQEGELLQFDSPYRIYHMPKQPFVANFISQGNMVNGMVQDKVTLSTPIGEIRGTFSTKVETGEVVKLLIRPEDVSIDNTSDIRGKVIEKSFMGSHFMFTLDFGSNNRIRVMSTCGDYGLGDLVGLKHNISLMTVFSDCPYLPV